MLVVASSLKGFEIAAKDGAIGKVSDLLFDDRSWRVRWLVIDTGAWLSGRKVLLHPSEIGEPDHDDRVLPVSMTRAQVHDSPAVETDMPVSQQMERSQYQYYGWDPLWTGGGYMGGWPNRIPYPLGMPQRLPLFTGDVGMRELPDEAGEGEEGNPHLRSATELVGYHIHASDGLIGHIENLMVDDRAWQFRYMIVDTRNWWPGQHVLMSPYAITEIVWSAHEVRLDVKREAVRTSTPWDPAAAINRAFETSLQIHYHWPG